MQTIKSLIETGETTKVDEYLFYFDNSLYKLTLH